MRNYRRFELHKGNKEKFWEIRRYDKTLYFREGNIKRKSGEKAPTTVPDEKKDFRQAQLAYDKEIQRKLALGYVEVEEASAPAEDILFQALRLESLDGTHTLNLNEAEATKILNFMIDKEIINKRAAVLNISRWERRALHGSDYKNLADIDPLSADYCTYFDKWHKLSLRDRQYNEEETIPLFKYTDPQYWIVTAEECQQIIQSIQSEITKRRAVLNESEPKKKASPYFRLKEAWLEFHLAAEKSGGYQVVPCALQFHSVKRGHSFFLDSRNWNEVFNILKGLDIWDHSEASYISGGFDSVEAHVLSSLVPDGNLDNTPITPDSSDRENLIDQLLTIEDTINAAHGKDKKALLDGGFRWNKTNVSTLIKVLENMTDTTVFETELADYHDEELAAAAELECQDGNIDADTQRVINEILNDACHLLNHAHANIHNTEEFLFPIAEDQAADVFAEDLLENVIEALQYLFPKILDFEVESEEQILNDYTYRPAGLDEELMATWEHLLPDSYDCVELLQDFLTFIQVEDALLEQYPTAREFCLKYLKETETAMIFNTDLQKARQAALRRESNTLGKVLLYKLTDLSEPWVMTTSELTYIIEAVYQEEEKNPAVLALIKFFNTAADSDGCTLRHADSN